MLSLSGLTPGVCSRLEIENKARRRSRNLWITLAVIIALFIAIIVVAIVADS